MRRTSFSCAGVRVEIESREGSWGRSSSTERWQSCFAVLMILRRVVGKETGVVQAAWSRGGGSGARQQGPGLAVRPVCFRRVFGGLPLKAGSLAAAAASVRGIADSVTMVLAFGLQSCRRPFCVSRDVFCLKCDSNMLSQTCAADFSIEFSSNGLFRTAWQAEKGALGQIASPQPIISSHTASQGTCSEKPRNLRTLVLRRLK